MLVNLRRWRCPPHLSFWDFHYPTSQTASYYYTPDIRSMWGDIVFTFPYVRSFVSSFRHRVCVKVYFVILLPRGLGDIAITKYQQRYAPMIFFFFFFFFFVIPSRALYYAGASLCATSYYLPRAYNAPLGGALV